MRKRKNVVIITPILFGIWLLLNNSLETSVIISGIIVSLIIALILCARCDVLVEFKFTPKAFIYTILYLLVFFFELIKSNLDVAIRVLKPSLPINPGIVEVKTKLKSKMARMILANSITLTPGTLTVEVQDDSFFIHWIDVKSTEIDKASKELVEKFEKYLEEIYD